MISIIHSLAYLQPYLNQENASESEGIHQFLLLDFDQTCVTAATTLGNERFYRWFACQNEAAGRQKHLHYDFVNCIREKIPYRTCENKEMVNGLLTLAREKRWTVKIITARTEDLQETTFQNLQDAGLEIEREAIIFSPRLDSAPKDSLKGELIFSEIVSKVDLAKEEPIKILFVDDLEKHCLAVAKVAEKIRQATVECFHFIQESAQAPSATTLSLEELEAVVVQYFDYINDRKIRSLYSLDDLLEAQRALGIQEINEKNVYECLYRRELKPNRST